MRIALPPDGSRSNLVMGVIENYGFEIVRPFLVSLRRSGFDGDLVLFHHRVDARTIAEIRGFGAILVPFRSLSGAFPQGRRERSIARIARAYHRLKWPAYETFYHLLLHAAKLRYVLYHRYLGEHGWRYDRALLTDTRDVVFQGDPFAALPAEDILFFEEDHPLGFGRWNGMWLRRHLGEQAAARLAARMTLCSGTTIGRPQALRCYLERYLGLMKAARRQDLRTGDQSLHNALVYEGMQDFPFSRRICRNGEGPVYTLTEYMNAQTIERGPDGTLLGSCGHRVPVIHQYDRHPDIVDALSRALLA